MSKSLKRTAEKVNYNVSAYRVLYILLLLVQHRSLTLTQLNALLLENPLINRSYNSETITKYINTLRQVGCQIPRANSKQNFQYNLLKNPFPLPMREAELRAAHRLLLILASQPDEDLHVQYYEILKKVAWSIDDETKARLLFDTDLLLADREVRHRRELLSKYKRLCKDGQALELTYRVDRNETVTLHIEPSRVQQEGRRLYLIGQDRKNYKEIKLDLDYIESARQLPYKVQNRVRLVNVVFVLTGRLAKTYRRYPDESVLSEAQDKLYIKARTDDYQALLARLMKYGSYCEVVSPLYVRQEMAARVREMLAAFDVSTE